MEPSKNLPYLQKINIFLISITLLSIVSCEKKAETSAELFVAETKDLSGQPRMRPSDLYKNDSVSAFMSRCNEQNQKNAEPFYQQYAGLRKDDQNKAAWVLKNALTYYPNKMWYRELGDMLLETRNFNEAKDAYGMYLKYDVETEPGQMINILKATVLADDNESRYDVGEKAKTAGVTTEQFQTLFQDAEVQKRMSPKEIESFLGYLLRYVSAEGEASDTTLPDIHAFAKEFETIALPFKMDEEGLVKHEYSEEYFDYDPSRDFSKYYYERTQNFDFYPDYDFKYSFKNGAYTGLIYSADTSAPACLRKNRCIYHRLLIYDADGNLKSTQVIGVHAGEKVRTYEIDKNGVIKVYDFKREWKKPFDKNSMDNTVLSKQAQDTILFKINNSGIIEEN